METKSLLVRFGTDTAKMEAGFKKADGLIQKNSEKFKQAGRGIAVAGAAIVGSLGLMVKGYAAAGDEVHKMALRTGFSTEALSELKYAAEISGTSLATVEKGVKKMASSIGEAELGVKTYTDAFKLIGIEVSELQGLNPEEQFMKMAAGIAEIEDPTQRAYAAQKLLGRAGTELLPLFAEGAEGMEELRQKARDMGLSISGPAAQGAADLTDAMTDMKGSFKGVTMAISEQLAPIIQGLVETVTNATMKMKDWIKENPILAGVLVKVAGAVGVLFAILGPLLMMLPMLSAGFTILWGAITGPVGLVIGAIALVAGAALLIYKNWEPIKEFFLNLWTKVTGFFSDAFNGIKKKLLDFAITIMSVLAKIPIYKKLAGPWKESLESMRAEMDVTARGISESAAQIEADAQDLGMVWRDAIMGTTLFKDAMAAVKEETGLLNKIIAVSKVGISAWSEGFEKANEKMVAAVIVANTKITGMVKGMVDEIKKLTMDEYEYSKWALDQKLADRIETINAETAAEDAGAAELQALEEQKNKAIETARNVHYNELSALDKSHKAAEVERQKTAIQTYIDGYKVYYDNLKIKQDELAEKTKAANAQHLAEQATLIDSLNQLEMDRFTYANWALDQRYEKEKETSTNLGLLWAEYQVQKAELENLAREEESAARKLALENTLADISNILGMIGGLFRQSLDNKLEMINQEEEARLESINAQYDAQISALQGVLDAERQKTEEVLQLITDEYEKKRQHILDNMEDNAERTALLEALEENYQAQLDQARIDREQAEADAAEAIIAIEDAKNEALRLASEELEGKRSAARRTAAKQEKAVALLSAIVNTAAAIAKALPNIPLAIAVGILGAIQIAIIAATPLPMKEGGIITKPTVVMAGEAGPEAFIPLDKLGGFGDLQPAPVYVKQSNYFYGDINNAGDMDAISDQLAKRLTRQLERGRG